VQIKKRSEEDGRRAIAAAFAGHRSLKHAFVVDEDVDPYDPAAVEWALATRFQADRDLVIVGREPGSSLDPSAEGERSLTCKVGFDLTAPRGSSGKSFERAAFPRPASLDAILAGLPR
jgi:UbiD family decarboxylase